MALAVCLLFDRRGDLLVRNLWAHLENDGIRTLQSHTHGHHHPHLSYAVLLEWDTDRVLEALNSLPDGGPFDLTCQGAVVFPRGRVALAASVAPEVAERQAAVARALASTGAVVHRHYEPGQWVPHISLATRATGATLPQAVTAIADTVPITLGVDRAALVDTSTGDLRPLPSLP
jgi:2'-5' RNA ligase